MNTISTTLKEKRLFLTYLAVMIIVTIVLLRVQGRLWICTCGRVDLWSGEILSSDNSQHIFDPYSFTHVLHGFVLFWLVGWLLAKSTFQTQVLAVIGIESVWEVVENSKGIIDRYRETATAQGYTGDTIVNSLSDIALCGVGVLIARRLGFKWAFAVFLIVEILLALWIKDGLLLNVINLLLPLDAIREWQSS